MYNHAVSWLAGKLSIIKKTGLALLLPACILSGCTTPEEPEPAPQIVLTPEYTELQAPARVLIEYEIVPEDADVKLTGIQNSGVYIRSREDRLIFETDKPGTYTVSLNGEYTNDEGEQVEISSNNAVIVVKEASVSKDENESSDQDENKPSDASESKDTDSSTEESTEETADPGASDNPNAVIPADEDIYAQAITVDQAVANADSIIENGKDISIEGFLPQDLAEVSDGSMQAVIWNNGTTQYIILDNPDVLDIGGTRAQLNGILSRDENGDFHFNIKRFRQLNSAS